VNIAVFCSGNGTNFQAIVDSCKKGLINADVALMVCDNQDAYALKRAKEENIKTLLLSVKDFSSKDVFEARIIEELEKEKIELICLAGYMRILGKYFVERYRNRIINIHPALLPSFKGNKAIDEAWDYGVKLTGITIHFVNEDMDAGPIILQEPIKIEENDTRQTLEEKIHNLEHKLYPEAIRLFIKGNLSIAGRRVMLSKLEGFQK